MNKQIFAFLATFQVVRITEAYTGTQMGSYQVDSEGNLNSRCTTFQALELDRIAEIRFRANENPEIYYETNDSRKMFKALNMSNLELSA